SVENVNVRAVGLPKPQLIVVHDFGVTPGDVALDSAIGARLTQMAQSTPASEQEVKVGREVARIVRESLVKEISKLGIPAVSAATATPVVGPSLSIEGQFLSVDEGNRLRRMVVGFGAGASEVRTLVQVYETTSEGRRLVEDFYTTVKSSRKPGMGPMVGVGAAAGRAVMSAAASTGVGLATEHSQTVEGDAKHTADEITKVLKKVFAYSGMRELAFKASGIKGAGDLRGRKVAVWFGGNEFALLATLEKYRIDPQKDATLVQQPFDMNLLLQKQVDAAAAMTYNEYKQVLDAGVKPEDLVVIDFNKEGTAMLEDGVFVKADYLKAAKNRDVAARFVRASLKGWEFCRDKPAECVDIVLKKSPV